MDHNLGSHQNNRETVHQKLDMIWLLAKAIREFNIIHSNIHKAQLRNYG